MAFFKGIIKHTNEITIDIGAGYYIECSTFHAKEILNRKITSISIKRVLFIYFLK